METVTVLHNFSFIDKFEITLMLYAPRNNVYQVSLGGITKQRTELPSQEKRMSTTTIVSLLFNAEYQQRSCNRYRCLSCFISQCDLALDNLTEKVGK